jgi:hypothetical protein
VPKNVLIQVNGCRSCVVVAPSSDNRIRLARARGIHTFFLLVVFFVHVPLHASSSFQCPASRDYRRPHDISGYRVQMLPGPKNSPYRCRGTLRLAEGKPVTVARDWAMSLDPISGNDINGDGIPDVVFDGFSGAETCCYTYWIVSLGKKPRVVREIHNQVPLVFRRRSDGSTEIRTGEGSFDLFLLPHSEAVIPQLILRLQGSQLTDISSEYREEYDKQITEASNELTSADLEKFRQSHYNQRMFTDQLPTVKRVLTIVLNYLYSGREQQAWEALDKMWPPSDKERMRDLILERRARGLLGQPTARQSSGS